MDLFIVNMSWLFSSWLHHAYKSVPTEDEPKYLHFNPKMAYGMPIFILRSGVDPSIILNAIGESISQGKEISASKLNQMLYIADSEAAQQDAYRTFLIFIRYKDTFPGISYRVIDRQLRSYCRGSVLEICRVTDDSYFRYV